MLKNQLSVRSDLVLDIGELSGNPFGSLRFNDIRLLTPRGYEIVAVSEINFRYGLIHFLFNRGEIRLLSVRGVQFSYPASIDSLSGYFTGSQGTGIKSRLLFKKFEIIDLNISNSNKLTESILTSDYLQGRILLLPDSASFFIEEGNLDLYSIDEHLRFENTQLTVLPDSLIIQGCSVMNRSTTIDICGYAILDSMININLDCNVKNLVFSERFPGMSNVFAEKDFMNFQGNLDLSGNELTFKSSFNGQMIDNKISKGLLCGVYQNGSFNLNKMSFESGKQLISGSLSGDMVNGAEAVIDVSNINLHSWQLFQSNTSINGQFRLKSLGALKSPDTLFADLALGDLLIDTLQIDSVNGKFLLSNGVLEIIDTISVGFKKTDIKIEGLCNLDSNSVNARAYFTSDSLNVLSDLIRIRNLQGRLEGYLEATGHLNSPDFRGWLRGLDVGVSNLFFEEAIARFGLMNIQENRFGDIYVEATNGTTPLFKETIPLASLIVRFEKDTAIVRSLRVVGEEMNIEVQGKIVQYSDLFFDKINVYRDGNYLNNIDPIHISLKEDTISLAEVRFSLNKGMIVLSGESVNNRIQSAVINIRDLDINPVNAYLKGSRGVAGVMDGLISYADTAESPTIYSRLKVDRANIIGKSFKNIRLESRLVKDRIILENIFFEDNEKGYMNGFGRIDCHYPAIDSLSFFKPTDFINVQLQFDNFDVSTLGSFILPKMNKDGKLSGAFTIRNMLGKPEFDYEMTVADPVFDRLSANTLQAKGVYRNHKLEFTNIQLRDQYGVTSGAGYLPFTFSFNPINVKFQKDSLMFINFTLHSKAVEFLSTYINNVESIEGDYNIALNISGTPNNPVRSGNVTAKNGTIRVSALENPVTGVTGSAVLRDNMMEIISMEGYMIKPISRRRIDNFKQKLRQYTMDILFPSSKSPDEPNVTISGFIDFSKFFNPVFNIKIEGEELYIRTLLAEQEGILDGTFTVTGRDTMNIEGEVDINEFIIRNEFGGSESLIEEEKGNGRVYTTINLHTIIPGNLYFRNSQLDCELEGEMWIIKNGAEPYRFSGTLDIRKGKFFYYGWEFGVVQGSIIFDPTEFNPTLDIEARVDLASYTDYSTTEATSSDEDYVTVRLSGDLLNPLLEFDSDKYNEGDILMFLTRTQLGTEDALNQSRISSDAMNMFEMWFERQMEKRIGQISGLDEFELRTKGNLFSNLQPDQWSVSLGQKLAPNLYFKYERNLSLIEPTQLFGIEYRLNRNFSVSGEVEQDGSYRINYIYKYRY
ncbi:MAG: translocation/assembly module TamB domain-containing protein [Candidatus Marinimicrobia bacterium]|nr:translocation/assembly module TamB domain-containing protein [Candidatus Neomarinimicrobiota bacterium]